MGIFLKAIDFGASLGKSAAQVMSRDWMPYSLMNSYSGGVAKSGIQVSEQSALFSSAVFACQRAISESIAVLPRDIFKKQEGKSRISQPDHLSNRILKREANPLMSSYRFFELITRHSVSAGNGYAEIQLDKATGDAVALWPLPPHRVLPRCFSNNGSLDLIYDITLTDGSIVSLTKDRVLHIAGIGFDGVRGYPLMDYMLQAVGLDQAIANYSSSFFEQGAGLGGYVSVPDSFTEDQIQNLKQHYSILNDGLDNAHRFKFLYESSKFTPSSATPNDSQMHASRIFQIQEIARFHRMPLHKIQETSKAPGYDSLEQFNIEFLSDTLTPHIVNWEQELDRKLFLEAEGLYIKFNVNAILRGDSKSRSQYYRTMVFTSLMTPNEARALEDMPPIEGGDERLVPLNMAVDGVVPGESKKSQDANARIQD